MKFAFLDLELTGLQRGVDRIIEIAIRLESAQQERILCWERLVNPERAIGAFEVHGIQEAQLQRQPAFGALAADVAEMLQDAYVVGYHVAVDREFLELECERAGVLLTPAGWVDVRRMAKRHRGLADLAASLDVPVGVLHRAAADAALTREVFWRLYDGRPLSRFLLPTHRQGPVVAALQQHLAKGDTVTIRYDRGRGEKRFVVSPLAIEGAWLTARAKPRSAPRRYRLDRIVAVEV